MIGVFAQPEFVLCDTSMLQSLDARQFRAGFSEIIKAGAIKTLLFLNTVRIMLHKRFHSMAMCLIQ